MTVGLRDRKHYRANNNPLDKDSANLAKKHKDLQLTEHLAPSYRQDGTQTDNYETAHEDNQYEADDLADQVVNYGGEDDDNFYDSDNDNGVNNYGNAGLVDNELEARRQRINTDFKDYVAFAKQHVCCFTYNQHTALKLMTILRKSKASLDTYDDIMRWHFVSNETLKEHEKLNNTGRFISRAKLFKMLRKRYNMNKPYFSQTSRIMLPSSKTAINIVWSDAAMQVQSLLTDPRIRQEDFLFFAGGPFSPPPADLNYVCDLNTGLSYTETYRKLIKNPAKQVLLPTPLYIDGAVTGQFLNLPITAFRLR